MKYLILIYSNPASRSIWEGFSDAQRAERWSAYAALNADLAAPEELIVSEALADPALTKRVSTGDGTPMTTDGPFAEVKELLAGFFLLECESLERAIAIAARAPEAEYGPHPAQWRPGSAVGAGSPSVGRAGNCRGSRLNSRIVGQGADRALPAPGRDRRRPRRSGRRRGDRLAADSGPVRAAAQHRAEADGGLESDRRRGNGARPAGRS